MSGMIKRGMAGAWIFALAFFCAILSLHASPAQAGYAHFIMDANTGKVLAARNADVLNHPASLTKMMTLYLTFEALHAGKLRWDQKITMSKNGASVIPSKLYVRQGQTFTVREAVYGMIVKSANDMAEGMGDHLGGSEARFAEMMTRKARQLGMTKTVFRNASGLPNKSQVTTARDMAKLGLALQRDFPKEYGLFATQSFNFRGKRIRGHNNLMYRYQGMDGIKTGYTNASGFNLVSAVNHNGRRVVGVVLGGKTARSRDAQMAALLDKAVPQASRGRNTEQLVASANVSRTFDVAAAVPPAAVPLPMFAERRADPVAMQIATANADVADMMQVSAIPRPAPAAAPSGQRSRWEVQIAATDSEAAARSLLANARSNIGNYSGIAPYTEAVQSGSATLYRARFTGFEDQSSAVSACKALKARSYACVVMTSEG
ncbi:UNVERIFIED_ORG: D-alanyl-D-alanine carboxypeptidase (penicillin-binding protein 5/6) [Rhizobium sp. SORGH_AS260]|uniref:D-alanyl-D-alanine carboxypeptidase n=6 Tax=Bacteria TaxID=2 RepID=A0A9W5F3F7_9HYPH|nr:D-alanyl-D-alanine carboxypeptidase (penicillin-binding protein 5/6) [Rhizobium sp. SORGH_AS_0285]MDP9754223.1 D-alanyl-D-alanine carboxypeptidase (penicillin-binding protein 5/6) [Rhizobium sp. SORGH_AS_0260]MDR6083128.1 D-alanyl-D-alanine carboxypeptidase (penicillin-binding protein 5/6) [Agrobacterium sp. SORGH_AS_0440]CAD7023011.1 peptidase M15 [Rhizobium sp. P007]CUW90203.1 D-alanyl-D-alanine carboxypeptidase [Agrobacterium genomosp. 2 str. CFBP 5494]HCJ74117.1 peptidase M15 [Agrobacte